MDDLTQRAVAAWFRSGGQHQPSTSDSGIEEHAGKEYVALRNVKGVLKLYRVRPDGILKGLRDTRKLSTNREWNFVIMNAFAHGSTADRAKQST